MIDTASCKHHIGDHHNKTCAAGVCYADVTTDHKGAPGWAYRKPCILWDKWHEAHAEPMPDSIAAQYAKRGTCEKFELPSAEEIADYKRRTEAAFAKTAKTFPLMARIKKEHKGHNWQGVEVCPVCGGSLHMTHAAYNGHTWGKCDTANCVAWME